MPHIIDDISGLIGLILQCATLITIMYGFFKFTQKPTETLNSRVELLEKWKDKQEDYKEDLEQRLHQGSDHFEKNDDANRVTQGALLTILDTLSVMEGVPDNAKAEVKKSRNNLFEYLKDK